MSPKKTLVFTATYNEIDCIESLVRECLEQLPGAQMLVVDDNSPDGTGQLLDRMQQEIGDALIVIHRSGKLGLGTAHKLAMKYTIEHKYDYLITMDADFSHQPSCLPAIVKELGRAEFVIGSRYVTGGNCDYEWKRQLLSRTANLLARTLLGIEVHETTTSYRGFRRELLERLPIDRIKAEGYAFFFESIYFVSRTAERLSEIPIAFKDRRAGSSKISKKEIARSMKRLLYLAWGRIFGLNRTSEPSAQLEGN